MTRLRPEDLDDAFGEPTRLEMEVAAMASVVATTAPKTKPRRQFKAGNPRRQGSGHHKHG